MRDRPLSVSIAASILVILGSLSLLASIWMLFVSDDPRIERVFDPRGIPSEVVTAIELAMSVITLVCGIQVLNAANWARWLYTVAYLIYVVYLAEYFSDSFPTAMFSVAPRVVAIIFLFWPGTGEFFSSRHRG